MTDPKDKSKQTGDTHPPELDDASATGGLSEDQGTDGTRRDRGLAGDLADEAKPGKGENQAGFLKENESPGR